MEKYFLIKKYFSTFFPRFSHFFYFFSLQKQYYFYEKTWNQKKIFCFNFLSMSPSSAKCFHIWFDISKVTSVEKRELRKHFSALACSFLGLGLQPRPKTCGLGFKKLFLSSLFSTLITLKNLKSDSIQKKQMYQTLNN